MQTQVLHTEQSTTLFNEPRELNTQFQVSVPFEVMDEKQYKTLQLKYSTVGKFVDYIVEPLSQDDLAHGWTLVTPSQTRDKTVFHFSVYLSQLPHHLWSKLRYNTNNHNIQTDEYKQIKDKIYLYSVKKSKSDSDAKQLYNLIMHDGHINKPKITELVHKLEKQNVKGWLMIRARSMMH